MTGTSASDARTVGVTVTGSPGANAPEISTLRSTSETASGSTMASLKFGASRAVWKVRDEADSVVESHPITNVEKNATRAVSHSAGCLG